jgi:hypothetical protein
MAMDDLGLDKPIDENEPEITNTISKTGNPAEALSFALQLPGDSILFFHNAQRYIGNEAVCQAIMNLRNPFTNPRRTLVMLATSIELPPELMQDVLVLDEPLPDSKQLAEVTKTCYTSFNKELASKGMPTLKIPEGRDMEAITDALTSLAAFPCEQVVSMSLSKDGIDTKSLWERKYKTIEQTDGLFVYRGNETFDDIGGAEQIKKRLTRIMTGKKRWRCVAWVDEIEKSIAGATGPVGDSSGTSQYALGKTLTEMQENMWDGFFGVGPGGSGKSLIAKAIGNTFGIPTFIIDYGAMQASLVGQSQQRVSAVMKILKAVGGDGVFWVATCNKIKAIPPELKRRFTKGIYYFDLASEEEKKMLWSMYLKKYNLEEQKMPCDDGWTGANIAACCRNSCEEGVSILEAAESIVPITKSDPEGLTELRTMANGRFLSTTHPGAYVIPKVEKRSSRKMEV